MELNDNELLELILKIENEEAGTSKGAERANIVQGEVKIANLGTLIPATPEVNRQVNEHYDTFNDEVSLEKARQFIEDQKKPNTVRATQRDVKNIQDWLATKKFELRNIEDIPPHKLADYLTQYFVFIERKDGSQYQPSTLTNMLYGLDRHLRSMKYSYFNNEPVNILKDTVFHECRTALSSKRIALKKQGLGNRPQRSLGLESREEEKLWQCGVLGKLSGFNLQFTMWYHMTLIMGLRGRDEHRRVKFGDLTLSSDTNNQEYLELTDHGGKTRDGATRDDTRATSPKIFCTCQSNGTNRCVIEIYKELKNRRPKDFCKPEDPFYLQTKTDSQIASSGTDIWFKREPLGVGSLGKFLPKACSIAGIAPRGNHGVRATTVQRLREAKVPDDKIIQITGHKSVRTLAIYDTEKLSTQQHKEMQEILVQPTKKARSACSTITQAPSTTDADVPCQEIDIPVSTNIPVQFQQMQSLQNKVLNQSIAPGSAMFSGAIISNCIFNLTSNVPKDGSGDN